MRKVELWLYNGIRQATPSQHPLCLQVSPGSLSAVLFVVMLLVFILPYLLSGMTSLADAGQYCRDSAKDDAEFTAYEPLPLGLPLDISFVPSLRVYPPSSPPSRPPFPSDRRFCIRYTYTIVRRYSPVTQAFVCGCFTVLTTFNL